MLGQVLRVSDEQGRGEGQEGLLAACKQAIPLVYRGGLRGNPVKIMLLQGSGWERGRQPQGWGCMRSACAGAAWPGPWPGFG